MTFNTDCNDAANSDVKGKVSIDASSKLFDDTQPSRPAPPDPLHPWPMPKPHPHPHPPKPLPILELDHDYAPDSIINVLLKILENVKPIEQKQMPAHR